MSFLKPTPPTVIVGFPVTFRAHPARPIWESRSASGNAGIEKALLQRLAAVRGRLSLCADQAAAAKWWLSMPMASVSAEGQMPKALRSEEHTSELQSLMRTSYAV